MLLSSGIAVSAVGLAVISLWSSNCLWNRNCAFIDLRTNHVHRKWIWGL